MFRWIMYQLFTKPIVTRPPPRFILSNRELLLVVLDSKGSKGGAYPW